jgi:pimeloyl-ACP methyl ester carboxylesterase
MEMKRIYIVPGLAVDERLFKNIRIGNAELIPVKWLTTFKNETLPAYAKRLSAQIDLSRPFYLMGVSFGGMCAIEIAKLLHPVRTIIISSAKGPGELPWYFTVSRLIPFHLWLGDRFAIWLAAHSKWLFGVKKGEQAELFYDMMDKAPEDYTVRAINCIVKWKNTSLPGNLTHIHGTRDRIIPIRNVKNCIPVKGGTHFMIMNSAGELNRILNDLLNKTG